MIIRIGSFVNSREVSEKYLFYSVYFVYIMFTYIIFVYTSSKLSSKLNTLD
jgi:hypothetical protein